MKVLLDENFPHQLRLELPEHDVSTVAYMGWSGIHNGASLRQAPSAGFDAMMTNDRGFEHQQNLNELPFAVMLVLAPSNTIETLRPSIPQILEALAWLQPRQFIKVIVQ